MALIFMAPEFIKMFKEMTGVKPMSTALNLGSFFSGATVAIGGAFGLASQFHTIKSTLFGARYGEGLAGRYEGDKYIPSGNIIGKILSRMPGAPRDEGKK